MLKKISGSGGIVAYLGTRDFREVEARCAAGDSAAIEVYDAFVYQGAKEICAQRTALTGGFDGVILTGGMANSKKLTDDITRAVGFLGDVFILAGERELEALADYMHMALYGTILAQDY
jgi:butyrate kinase